MLLTLNGAFRLAATAVASDGAIGATLNLFGISAIIWMAIAAGVALAFAPADRTPMSGDDRAALFAAMAVMMIPLASTSAASLTALALWVIVRTPRGVPLRRSAIIFLAITGSLIWGHALLTFGSDTLLGLDGWITGLVAGTGGAGNVVQFAGNAGAYFVAPGCSSLQGVSLAIVLWTAAVQYFEVPITGRAVTTLAAAMIGAIAANVGRLAAIATWPAHFDWLHSGAGAMLFGWLALILVIAAVTIGLRDALFRRS